MGVQPQLIAPFQTGLDIDTEAWMSPADAFSEADNVHVFNGYIEKRSGYRVFGHLKHIYSAGINISAITNAVNGLVTTAVNHGYFDDDVVYISGVVGMTQVNGRYFKITVTALNQFLLNEDTTLYGVYGAAGTSVKSNDYIDRVMGIYQFKKSDGSNEILAFGTTRAHKYDVSSESFLMLDSADIFTSTDTDYVWGLNLQSSSLANRLYFTNGIAFNGTANGIRYYDGSGTGYTTTQFTPDLGGGRFLYGCKLIFSIKERLVALSTLEHNAGAITTHMQRARWCKAQGPSTWDDLIPGGGGYIDAPTGDQIVTARALQDQIIVFFSQSIWSLQPLSDPALPFRWVKLNDFRAADGKMASVGFDRYVISLGTRGITATDGADTQRVDQRIQSFIFDEINIDKFAKVFAARSFANRRTWILYPEIESDENSSALVFDEASKAFTTYTLAMNCLGYGSLSTDYTLADFIAAHDLDIALEDCDDETIESYFWQSGEDVLLGGDIVGNVYVLETESSDNGTSISSVITTAGWNPFQAIGAQAYFSYVDIYVDTHERTLATVEFFKDDETAPYASQIIDFLPNLDYVSTVEFITQAAPGIVTASDHGLSTDDVVFLYGIRGMDRVNGGPFTITVLDKDHFSIGIDTSAYGVFLTGGSVFRRQFFKTKTWKRAFAGGVGYLHKIKVSSEGTDCPFRISGFKPVFKPRGKRIVN